MEEKKNYSLIKRSLILLFLFALLISFHKPIEEFLLKSTVNPLLSKISVGGFTDIFLFLIIVGIASKWFFYNSKMRKQVDKGDLILLCSIALFYSIYRFQLFGFDRWDFYSLHWIKWLKYFDLLLIYPAILILYKLSLELDNLQLEQNEVDADYVLEDDWPIESDDADDLNRADLAKEIAKYVLNTSSKGSIALGFNAMWGDGKTSFQNLIKNHLLIEDKSIITIEFNPWRSSGAEKIVSDFFETFSDTMSKYDLKVGKQIKKYSSKIASIKSSWISNFINDIVAIFYDTNEGYNHYYQQISNSIIRIDRKIVFFIDDLDRLDSTELLQVIKLMRNSANFQNTFFIVGFDREYLIQALSKHTEYGNKRFLDKIFQIVFDLSKVPEELLINRLKTSLLAKLPEYGEEIKEVLENEPDAADSFASFLKGKKINTENISSVLANIRDLKRFVNFFVLSFRIVGKEVVFSDYFYLSLLKFKFPIIIFQLKKNPSNYLETKSVGDQFAYSLKNDNVETLLESERLDDVDKVVIKNLLRILFN